MTELVETFRLVSQVQRGTLRRQGPGMAGPLFVMRRMKQRGELIHRVGCSPLWSNASWSCCFRSANTVSACVGLFDAASTAFHRAAW